MFQIKTTLFGHLNIGDPFPPVLMAVINLSPESFYKDSYIDLSQLSEKVSFLVENGVKIIDLGARSTAPGVTPISVEEELKRVQDALERIVDIIPKEIVLSIDTQYEKIIRYAYSVCKEKGISLILNDISSFKTDPKMFQFVIETKIPTIIMATKKIPGDTRTIEEIIGSLKETILALKKAHYPLSHLIIDPGVGRWIPSKTYEYDLAIIDGLKQLRVFGLPILIGLSRKSFLGSVIQEKDPRKRTYANLSATAIAVYNGAHIIRIHDMDKAMWDTIQTAYALRGHKHFFFQNTTFTVSASPFSESFYGDSLREFLEFHYDSYSLKPLNETPPFSLSFYNLTLFLKIPLSWEEETDLFLRKYLESSNIMKIIPTDPSHLSSSREYLIYCNQKALPSVTSSINVPPQKEQFNLFITKIKEALSLWEADTLFQISRRN